MTVEDDAAEAMVAATLQELGRHLAELTVRGRTLCDCLDGHPLPTLETAQALGRFRAAVDQAMPLIKMFLPPELEHLLTEMFPPG